MSPISARCFCCSAVSGGRPHRRTSRAVASRCLDRLRCTCQGHSCRTCLPAIVAESFRESCSAKSRYETCTDPGGPAVHGDTMPADAAVRAISHDRIVLQRFFRLKPAEPAAGTAVRRKPDHGLRGCWSVDGSKWFKRNRLPQVVEPIFPNPARWRSHAGGVS